MVTCPPARPRAHLCAYHSACMSCQMLVASFQLPAPAVLQVLQPAPTQVPELVPMSRPLTLLLLPSLTLPSLTAAAAAVRSGAHRPPEPPVLEATGRQDHPFWSPPATRTAHSGGHRPPEPPDAAPLPPRHCQPLPAGHRQAPCNTIDANTTAQEQLC